MQLRDRFDSGNGLQKTVHGGGENSWGVVALYLI